jgi:hypothetical protein
MSDTFPRITEFEESQRNKIRFKAIIRSMNDVCARARAGFGLLAPLPRRKATALTVSDISDAAFVHAEMHMQMLRGLTKSDALNECARQQIEEREKREDRAEAFEVGLRALSIEDLETLLERKRTFG